MKSIRGIIIGLGLFALPVILHAQTVVLGGLNHTLTPVQPAPPDSVVQVAAESQGLDLMSRENLPRGGTFWMVMPGGIAAPMPCPPADQTLPIYQICDNQFLVDATGGQVAVRPGLGRARTAQTLTSSQLASALTAQAGAVVDFIGQIQDAQYTRELAASLGMDFPGFGDGSGGSGGGSTYGYTGYTFDTNQLWLEITNVSNGIAYLNLHNGTNPVYAIWTTTNLLTPFAQWQMATEVWPSDTDCQPFSFPTLGQDIQFYRAEDWSTKDSDGDGIPDWWTWNYFGSPTLADTNLDYSTNGPGYGHTFGYDYSNNIPPTVFRYTSIHATNNYVGTSQSVGQLDVAGTPYYIAVSVDDTNFFTNATWQVYDSANVPVNLGSEEGWHEVWIGLRGHSETAEKAVWQHLWLKLDTTPPVLVITNPVNTTVDIPLIQIQGYSPEALSSICYDLTNAAGVSSNQPVLILNQYYDMGMAEYTTNWFQAFDVFLTNGLNALTFHATDLAGNVATYNYRVTVDYSAKTNPPNVQLIWPTNGMSMASDNVTIRGMVDDATVKVIASVTDTNNATNNISGVVERNGRFWLDNVPLTAGTNVIVLTATDAAGHVTTNQLLLPRSSITVTVNAPVLTNAMQTTVDVTGTVSDSTAIVWVNGVQGTTSGNNWSAANVPVPRGGVPTFDVTAYPADEAPDSGAGGGGTNPPTTPGAGNAGTATDQPACVYLLSDSAAIGTKNKGTSWDWNGYSSKSESETHSSHWWMAGIGGVGGESSQWESKNDNDPTDSHVTKMNGSYNLDENGNGWETGINISDGNSSSFSNPVWREPTLQAGLTWWVGNEHCGVADDKNSSWQEGGYYDPIFGGGTSHTSYTRSAQTTYHVQTGGRAIPGRQNLWRFSSGAAVVTNKYSTPPYYWYNVQGINPTLVQIRGQHLDTNGNVYIVLPDCQDLDVTPQVPGVEFYTFGIGWQKYHCQFTAFVDMPGPPPSHVTHVGTDWGHAWWCLSSDIPTNILVKFVNANQSHFCNEEVGYADHGSPYLFNGVLRDPETNTKKNEVKPYEIGFPGLTNGLSYTQGVHDNPGTYSVTGNNCVQHVIAAGAAAGLALPNGPQDYKPEIFGWDLINNR